MTAKQALHWQDLPAGKARIYFLATRPKFFTASVLPVLLGTAWGYSQTGQLNLPSFLLAVLAIIFVHACVNVLNDVYDDLNGTDRINTDRIFPFSGGSRFIQEGVLSREQMHQWGWILCSISILLGLLLIFLEGLPILWIGLAGLGLGVLYSAPPVALASRGLGELAVAIGTGMLPVVGSAWIQTHHWDFQTILIAIPISIWVGCILLINEIPDRVADEASGKRTLVVRLGEQGAVLLHIMVNAIALAGVFYLVFLDLAPVEISLLPAILFAVLLIMLSRQPGQPRPAEAMTKIIKLTLATHMLNGLWLTVCILI